MNERTKAIVAALKAAKFSMLPEAPTGWEKHSVTISAEKKALGIRGVKYAKVDPKSRKVVDSVMYITQNPQKGSTGAKLAREGHFVVCVYKPVGVWKGLIVDGVWWPMGEEPTPQD